MEACTNKSSVSLSKARRFAAFVSVIYILTLMILIVQFVMIVEMTKSGTFLNLCQRRLGHIGQWWLELQCREGVLSFSLKLMIASYPSKHRLTK